MRETIRPLHDVRQTSVQMYRLARQYASDVADIATLPILAAFDRVRSIPYGRDPDGLEYVRRPAFSRMQLGRGGPDCDDKAVVMGAVAHLKGIPFRFVAGARTPGPLHHTWPQLLLGGKWINFDPTYSYNRPGSNGPWWRVVALPEAM